MVGSVVVGEVDGDVVGSEVVGKTDGDSDGYVAMVGSEVVGDAVGDVAGVALRNARERVKSSPSREIRPAAREL